MLVVVFLILIIFAILFAMTREQFLQLERRIESLEEVEMWNRRNLTEKDWESEGPGWTRL